jgi:hypothetical protein
MKAAGKAMECKLLRSVAGALWRLAHNPSRPELSRFPEDA